MGPIRRLIVVALAPAVVVLGACATDAAVQVGAPASEAASSGSSGSSGSGSSGSGEVQQAVPVVGECRAAVDAEIIDAPADPRPAVDCAEPHGFETFFVGELDAEGAWPGDDEAAGERLARNVNAACSEAHLEYLGFDADSMLNLPPDRLQLFAYFIPTEEDFAAGARWFRCDALVEPLAAGESTTIDGTLEDVYGAALPAGYRLCEARLGQTSACDHDHELEYLASVDLSDLAAYPAQRGDPQVAAACRDPLLTALGLTVERQDLTFGYLLPPEDLWQGGARGATCVAGAADGAALDGTLAGIGPSTALPLAD